MGKGFGGMPGNMQQLMKQAQKMQKSMQEEQENAKNLQEEFTAGGGAIRVVANGENQIDEIHIDPSALDPENASVLEEMALVAINGALSKVQKQVRERMEKITGGMNIPGLG